MGIQPYMMLPANSADLADEWCRAGMESWCKQLWHDAERQFRQSLRLDPRHAPALNNLAITYAANNVYGEALMAAERATLLFPVGGEVEGVIRANWGLIALEAEMFDVALREARKGAELAPNKHTKLALALVEAGVGKPENAIPIYDGLLKDDPKHFPGGMNVCFAQTLTNATPEQLYERRKAWHEANKQSGFDVPLHQPSLNGKPLKVGYVSGDFKRHSASYIFGAVVLHHSPRVEPYLYSTLKVEPDKDKVTERFVNSAGNRWRDCSAMSDEDMDAAIRKDRIDILVDLSGHTGGGKLPLFTRRPAPVQVTAWGFAHGTGCPEIDWFFADPVAVPYEERCHYAERIWDLPCIVTYKPPVEYALKGVSKPPCQRNGYFTFGCYSRWEKLSDQCLAAFRDILAAVPGSRLELKDAAYRRPYCVKKVLAAMKGADPARLLFSIGTPHPDHLLAYQQADLILDPFPHSGGAACLEQLWMGVPIVTLYGTQAAGRTTASVLTVIGREGWIARSVQEYVEKAVDIATFPQDQPAAKVIRESLRNNLLASPVCQGYVAAVEAAYEEMVKQKTGAGV